MSTRRLFTIYYTNGNIGRVEADTPIFLGALLEADDRLRKNGSGVLYVVPGPAVSK